MIALEPLIENAVWRPELHPRDRLGRFRDVFKSVLKMDIGQWMDIEKVVGDAPNIEKAYIWRTKDGWEVRGSTKTGTYGLKITPQELANNEHEFEDRLQSLNENDPFADKSKCGCGCGAPAKSTYLPGHDARHKGNLVKAAQSGDTIAAGELEAKGWTKFLQKAKSDPGALVPTPAENEEWDPPGVPGVQEDGSILDEDDYLADPDEPEWGPPEYDPNVSSGQAGVPPDMLHSDPDLSKHWLNDVDDADPIIDFIKTAPEEESQEAPEPELDESIDDLESQLSPDELAALPDPNEVELDEYMNALEDAVSDKKAQQEQELYDPDAGLMAEETAADAAEKSDPWADVDPYPDLPTCNCGCGGTKSATAKYLPGHDSRHKSALVKAAKAGDLRALKTLDVKGWMKFLDKSKDTGPKKASSGSSKPKQADYEYDPSRVPAGLPISADVYPNFRLLDPGPGSQADQLERLKTRRDTVKSLVDRQMINEAMFRIRGGHADGTELMTDPLKQFDRIAPAAIAMWLAERGWAGVTANMWHNGKVRWNMVPSEFKEDLRQVIRNKPGRKQMENLLRARLGNTLDDYPNPNDAVRATLENIGEEFAKRDPDVPNPKREGGEGLWFKDPIWGRMAEKYIQKLNASGDTESEKGFRRWNPLYEKDTLVANPNQWAKVEWDSLYHLFNNDYEAFKVKFEEYLPYATEYERNNLMNYNGLGSPDYNIQQVVRRAFSQNPAVFRRWWDTYGREVVRRSPVRFFEPDGAMTGDASGTQAAHYARIIADLYTYRSQTESGSTAALITEASMHDVSFEAQHIDEGWTNELLMSPTPDRGRAMILRESPFEDHHVMVHANTLDPIGAETVTELRYRSKSLMAQDLRVGDFVIDPASPDLKKPELLRVVQKNTDNWAQVQPIGATDSSGLRWFQSSQPLRRVLTEPRHVPITSIARNDVIKIDFGRIQNDPTLEITVYKTDDGYNWDAIDNHPLSGGPSYRVTNVVSASANVTETYIQAGDKQYMLRFDHKNLTQFKPDGSDSPVLRRQPVAPEQILDGGSGKAAEDITFTVRGRIRKDASSDFFRKMLDMGAEEKVSTYNRDGSAHYGGWAGDKLTKAEKEATSLQLDLGDGKIVEFVPELHGSAAPAPVKDENELENRKMAKAWVDKVPENFVETNMRVRVGTTSYGAEQYQSLGWVVWDPKTRRILAIKPSYVLQQKAVNPDIPFAESFDSISHMPQFLQKMEESDRIATMALIDRIWNRMAVAKQESDSYGGPEALVLDQAQEVKGGISYGDVQSKGGQVFWRAPRDEAGNKLDYSYQAASQKFDMDAQQFADTFREIFGLDSFDMPVQSLTSLRQKSPGLGGQPFGTFAKLGKRLRNTNAPAPEVQPIETPQFTNFKKNVHSQRRRLRMHGFNPQEALDWLKANVGAEAEERVPYNQIYRSDRRMGQLALLHDDYADGTVQPNLGKHGVVHKLGSAAAKAFRGVAETGGLFSISEKVERRRLNGGKGRFTGYKQGTSEQGDIGSGLDDHIFMNLGSGVTYIDGDVQLVYKTETAMRKGVLITNDDFGGGEDRNPRYRNYMSQWGANFDEGATPSQVANRERMQQMSVNNELNIPLEAPTDDIGAVFINPYLKEDADVKAGIAALLAENPDVEIIWTTDRSKVEEWIEAYNTKTGFNRGAAGKATGGIFGAGDWTYEPGTIGETIDADTFAQAMYKMFQNSPELQKQYPTLWAQLKDVGLDSLSFAGKFPSGTPIKIEVTGQTDAGNLQVKLLSNPLDASDHYSVYGGNAWSTLQYVIEQFGIPPTLVGLMSAPATKAKKGGE